METSFNQPQRQSKVGILVMFLYTLQKLVRAFFPLILVFLFKTENLNWLYVIPSILVFISLLGLFAYLSYLNFTFFIDQESNEFVINEGVFNKTKTTIHLDKIQQVNINQSFIQKIIGVYALEIDTAGSTTKEVSIKAISHPLALALKTRLLENETVTAHEIQTDVVPEFAPENTEKPFIKISFWTLLKIGFTSNYLRSIGLLFLFYTTVRENLQSISDDENNAVDTQIGDFLEAQTILYGMFFVGFVLIGIVLVVNVVRTLIKFFGFTVSKQKGSLLLSFGLFNTKNTIVKPEKVQITTITRNYFQKKLDILEIKIQQASASEVQNKNNSIEIPGCSEVEKDTILNLIFSEIPQKGVMLKPNWRKLVFSLFLSIGIPFLIYTFIAIYIEPLAFDYVFLAVAYVIFVALMVFVGYRNNRLFVNDDFIIIQSGAWDVDHRIIEIGKIQALTTSQLFWHKKPDIGSLTIHTAGGALQFDLGNFSKVKAYINLWLYEVESKNNKWM